MIFSLVALLACSLVAAPLVCAPQESEDHTALANNASVVPHSLVSYSDDVFSYSVDSWQWLENGWSGGLPESQHLEGAYAITAPSADLHFKSYFFWVSRCDFSVSDAGSVYIDSDSLYVDIAVTDSSYGDDDPELNLNLLLNSPCPLWGAVIYEASGDYTEVYVKGGNYFASRYFFTYNAGDSAGYLTFNSYNTASYFLLPSSIESVVSSYFAQWYNFARLLNTNYTGYYNQGFSVGHDQGYSEGYADGVSDGETDGYTDGLAEGRQQGRNIGYQEGLNASRDDAQSLMYLFGAIASVPISILNGMSPLAIWGTPLIGILVTLLFVLLLAWLVRRFI